MPPKSLQLRRRRWTLVFSVPFTIFIAIVGAYSVCLIFSGDRFLMLIGGCSAFAAFCVGGTLGKSALEAWRNNDAAVVVDEHGLNDLRGKTSFIPWHQIETVKLDVDEQRVLVNMAKDGRRHLITSATRRLLSGADHTIALEGLSYSHHELAKALAEHHRYSKASRVYNGNASDA